MVRQMLNSCRVLLESEGQPIVIIWMADCNTTLCKAVTHCSERLVLSKADRTRLKNRAMSIQSRSSFGDGPVNRTPLCEKQARAENAY
jgi:hypothetical protein